MNKLLTIPLFLLSFYSYAGLEAIGGYDQLYNAPPAPLESFCQTDGHWQLCTETTDALPATYTDVFYMKSAKESIAFGSQPAVVACKADGATKWHDCTPDLPISSYVAYDGNDGLMTVSHPQNSNDLIATCRNAKGEWFDCTPPIDYAADFSIGGIGYGNGQWMVLEYAFPIRDGKLTKALAICMDATTHVWKNCDIRVPDPNQDLHIFNHVTYVANEELWVATGYTTSGNANYDVFFRSVCRKDSDTLWHDCTGGNFYGGGVRLVTDEKAGLLQINWRQDPITYKGYSHILCKAPNEAWKDCSSNSFQPDHRYYGATTDANGNWVMVGNHYETVISGGDTFAYLTAIQNGNDWQIQMQAPTHGDSMLYDVLFVKE